MARQAGPLFFTGTIDDITFYKMEGQYLARKKSSLNCKRFRTDPRFARSRKSAAAFGEASQLASAIYWQLPKNQRGKGVVNGLTAQVGRLLKEGKSKEEVQERLLTHGQTLQPNPATTLATKPTITATSKAEPATPILQPLNSSKHRTTKAKQARYLSQWKVKPNGRLQVPKPVTIDCLTVDANLSLVITNHNADEVRLE
ncbi:hypothetical protein [Flavisolibacter tropicus]|uniref:Uncharacterized protein n=1 Tax=Flavisolibacter tropicus TaxID=1492898 RepID=A0A172TZ84_9BACT|nr:hypothetical protein [Flavisolibacter tropicus]ANE52411.1 hypothetical protein SY85_19905 [Flavisolibacter tropicus]